jgi:YVTN family beta-propeller protein
MGAAMSKKVLFRFAVGSTALALLAPFLTAWRSDSLGRVSTSDALRPAAPVEAAVKPAVKAWPEVSLGRFRQEGISIECSMARVGGPDRAGNAFFEEDDVLFRFRITDGTGARLKGVYPAAWLLARPAGSVTTAQMAVKKAQSMVNASLLSPPDLDLNAYYVLALNANATITVVDPLFGYGGSKLLAMTPLKSPGADWALDKDESTLYVSLPESNEVAVVDTATWVVRKNVPGGLRPERIALQPDAHYLWVGGGGAGERSADSGVTVLNTATLDVAARIRTGMGRHDIAFSDDSRFAFVTNSEQGTVSVIDVRNLRKRGDVPTGKAPASIDFSTAGQVAYVTHAGDGAIAVVSGQDARVVRRLQAEPGLGQVRFAPGGRLGLVVNPEKDLVHILDAAAGQIVQSGPVERGPDQIAFSDTLAYLRHRDSSNVLMIPLNAVGVPGKKIPLVDFPAGQNPPGRMSRPCWATSMIQAPGASAMLVSNATDQSIYYYREGMAAPMGTFKNYSCEPLAVAVVDRSLRERTGDGVYETIGKLPKPDSYDVIFFLDTPRISCPFPVEVQASPELVKQRNEGKVDIKHIVDTGPLVVGKTARLSFKLTDRSSGAPKASLSDVIVQTLLVPASYERYPAKEVEPGTYAIELTPAEAGVYYVSVASAAIGLTHGNPNVLILRVSPADDATGRRASVAGATSSGSARVEPH